MKKSIIIIATIMCCCACASEYSAKNYPKYRGIDYNKYERQTPTKYAEVEDISPLVEEVQEEDLSKNTKYEEVPEITEEEIIESSNQAYGEAVVVMSSKKFNLGKNATSGDMQVFQTALDNSYNEVLKSYRTQGFTYAIAPAGTVNPLSTIDVSCVLSESFANSKGKKVCDTFFDNIPDELTKARAKVNK